MATICPALLAENEHEYREQVERVAPFAKRIQVDLTDGVFVKSCTIDLDRVWWPKTIRADLHMMYQQPMEYLQKVIELRPSLVIIHAEADVQHMQFAATLHKFGIKAGLCVLPDTSISSVTQLLHGFDHLLIFSGQLGHFGGHADLSLLAKAGQAKNYHPNIEIGWDGGINNENISALVEGGVDILDIGGFIQRAEDPENAYVTLKQIAGQP